MDEKQQQRNKRMKELKVLIEKHKENQQKIRKDWDKALNESREKVKEKFRQQKDGLTRESNSLKTRENQLIKELIQLEAQTKDEIIQLCDKREEQLKSLMIQTSLPSDASIDTLSKGVRDLQLKTCWDNTIKQMDDAINKQKTRINQLVGQSIDGQPAVPQSSGQSSQQLMEIRQQIDKTVKEMADNEAERDDDLRHDIENYLILHKKDIDNCLKKIDPKNIDSVKTEMKKVVDGDDQALEKAIKQTTDKFETRRNEMKKKLDKQRKDESDAMRSLSTPVPITQDRRSQQVNQIFSDTNKEMSAIIVGHMKMFAEMDKQVLQNMGPQNMISESKRRHEELLGRELNRLKELQKQTIDQNSTKVDDLVQQLDRTQRDMDNKQKELKEVIKKENDALIQCEVNAQKSQEEEIQKEMKKFTDKTKDFFK